MLILIPKHAVELADPRAELDDAGARKAAGKSAAASLEIFYVGANNGDPISGTDTVGDPTVYSIERPGEFTLPVTEETFEVVVRLSEEAKKDTFTKDRFSVSNAAITKVTAIGGSAPATPQVSTGRDDMVYEYLLTITPTYANKDDIVIKINEWESQEKPGPEKWMPPATDAARTEGVSILTVKVGTEATKPDKKGGIRVAIPKEIVIPEGGYLVVAKDDGSGDSHADKSSSTQIENPGDPTKTPVATDREPRKLTYNLIAAGLPNLETLLTNGGVIDVEGPHALVITEVMWGSDASLPNPSHNQWIELYNPGAVHTTADDDAATKDVNEAVTLVFYGPNEELPARADVHDRIGTVDADGAYWSIQGKGQSGRTGQDEDVDQLVAIVPTEPIYSMQRGFEEITIDLAAATDDEVAIFELFEGEVPKDGQAASSWKQSEPPGVNFSANAVGRRIGNPGSEGHEFEDAKVEEEEPTVPVAMPEDIMISEIMVDTGDDRLPQWIELVNTNTSEVSLAGWSVQITNSAADADVVGASVSINLSGTLGVGEGEGNGDMMGKTLLLVAWDARKSSNLDESGTVGRIVDVSDAVDQTGRYKLISDMAFMIALIPPQETGVLEYGDTAGNLGAAEAWDIPMSEGGRSSLIRREMDAAGMATAGTSANGWVLASSTALVSGPATWYGSDEDAGTPGYDAGGPLPVELSHFRPARDKQTGAVVITWSTQSELNNAGFFIKRAQQRDGQFVVVNPTMIAGAGTTSEKQFYTYTDTTAQPNVVYYYQIEDVSLDGNRQTLTNGIRLKGHIGAAGKLTTTWGDLKTQE